MNFNNVIKDCMKEEYARQIVDWKYEGEYAEYNLPSYEECIEKKYSIVKTDRKDNYMVYLMGTEVIFYSNIKAMEYNKLYFGVGLKPEYCGKGYSKIFLCDSIKEINNRYPGYQLFLEVRCWNKRAIKAYEAQGFKVVNTVISKDRLGNDTEFVEMIQIHN